MPDAQGRWTRGESGNPRGGKPQALSIAGILRQRLDKRAFCDHLIGLAMGTIPDTPHNTQVLASRAIMAYCDGLPLRREAMQADLRVRVKYVNETPIEHPQADVIDIRPAPQVEAGEDVRTHTRPDECQDSSDESEEDETGSDAS